MLSKGELLVFLEYCPLGSLETHLKLLREDSQQQRVKYVNGSEEASIQSNQHKLVEKLNQWSCQIAHGLKYLQQNNVIHGDLAARNILLNENKVAKITDFGLSRRLYDYTSYVKKQQQPLPWRYMAIESLQDMVFSIESDIWAYGVLLWEIYSLGEIPYPGMSWSIEYIENLKNGMRCRKPNLASNILYVNIILECWRQNPKERPKADVIINFFN